MQTIIEITAGSKITLDYGYRSIEIETEGKQYRLNFPDTAEDLVLACDTLANACQSLRQVAPPSVR